MSIRMYKIARGDIISMHVFQLLVTISRMLIFVTLKYFVCSVTSDRGAPNCFLSDIYQRDLLAEVDYVPDPDSWLFAWDNYNPKCVAIAASGPHFFGSDGNSLEDRGVFGMLHIFCKSFILNFFPFSC